MAGFSDQVAAVDAACRDLLTDPALWRVAGAEPGAPVGVILTTPDVDLQIGQSRLRQAAVLIDVFKADVAAPAQGDTVEMVGDGRLFRIIARPALDEEGTLWSCEATEVQA